MVSRQCLKLSKVVFKIKYETVQKVVFHFWRLSNVVIFRGTLGMESEERNNLGLANKVLNNEMVLVVDVLRVLLYMYLNILCIFVGWVQQSLLYV